MQRLLIGLACLSLATAVGAQDSLAAAKDLYAAAAYEDALSALTHLRAGTATPPMAQQIDQFRAFCLFALGRTAEAESVAEGLIAKDPLLQLDDRDASPRILAMFAEVRKRVLPGLIRDQYRAARASLDRQDFADAEAELTKTRRMLQEAQEIRPSDQTLVDLGLLVDGFLDLTRSTQARATVVQHSPDPSAVPADTAAAPPAPEDSSHLIDIDRASDPSAVPALQAAPPDTPEDPPHVYDRTATDVVAPVALHQQMPSFPPGIADVLSRTSKGGLLEIVIDEKGNVEQAVMREHVNPMFDVLVVAAARTWKYQPAMKDGISVRYLKSVVLTGR